MYLFGGKKPDWITNRRIFTQSIGDYDPKSVVYRGEEGRKRIPRISETDIVDLTHLEDAMDKIKMRKKNCSLMILSKFSRKRTGGWNKPIYRLCHTLSQFKITNRETVAACCQAICTQLSHCYCVPIL